MWIHKTHDTIDFIADCSKQFLEDYYGPDFTSECVSVDYPVGIGYKWDEYIEKFVPQNELTTPSVIAIENKLLRAQLQAQTERSDFIEDCIAEMATQVYGGV